GRYEGTSGGERRRRRRAGGGSGGSGRGRTSGAGRGRGAGVAEEGYQHARVQFALKARELPVVAARAFLHRHDGGDALIPVDLLVDDVDLLGGRVLVQARFEVDLVGALAVDRVDDAAAPLDIEYALGSLAAHRCEDAARAVARIEIREVRQ